RWVIVAHRHPHLSIRAADPSPARRIFSTHSRPLGGAGRLGQSRSLPRPEVSWSRDSKAHGAVPALTPHTTRTDHRRHRRGTPGDPLNRPPLAVTIPVAVPAGVGRRRDSAGPEGRCAMLTEEQAWVLVGLGFLSACALYLEQGTWAGLVVPVVM